MWSNSILNSIRKYAHCLPSYCDACVSTLLMTRKTITATNRLASTSSLLDRKSAIKPFKPLGKRSISKPLLASPYCQKCRHWSNSTISVSVLSSTYSRDRSIFPTEKIILRSFVGKSSTLKYTVSSTPGMKN